MLDIKRIQADAEGVKRALAKKGCETDFTELLAWDGERRAKIAEVERLKAERNRVSAEIPKKRTVEREKKDQFLYTDGKPSSARILHLTNVCDGRRGVYGREPR